MTKFVAAGTFGLGLSLAVLGLALSPFDVRTASAENAASGSAMTPAGSALDRAEVEKIVRDYLLSHPEILTEMQDVLEAKQKEEQRAAAVAAIGGNKAEIFGSPTDGIYGNPAGKKTVVEFYDYNCGYCRHALADMLAMTKADPDLRFVLKEFPILGPDSQKAHVVSMAFRSLMPEKYGEFHQQLLGSQGRAGEATALKIALSLGVDEGKLREAMKDPAITQVFDKTYDLANKLSITGTPTYVIGNSVVYGALGQEVLDEKIAEAVKTCGATTNC